MSVPIGGGQGLTNIEGHTDFDIVWPWHQGPLRRGATAVLRVTKPGWALTDAGRSALHDHVAALREGGEWESLVPPGVAQVIRELERVPA